MPDQYDLVIVGRGLGGAALARSMAQQEIAGSISLVGFGIDSLIEVTSDAVPEPWTHFSAVRGKPAESALLERPLPLPAGNRSDRLRGS